MAWLLCVLGGGPKRGCGGQWEVNGRVMEGSSYNDA